MVGGVTTIGVISDTHGLLRREALAVLGSVDRIIHAGDLDDKVVLQHMRLMASVTAVRGNCDRGPWARALPEHATVTIDGLAIHVIHDVLQIGIDPRAEGIAVVICGHTHRPLQELRDGVLYVNPGSAGPRRYGCPVSLGKLHIGAGEARGEIITLEEAAR